MKKVLFVASVVKTHIMQFHLPFLKLFKDAGFKTFVAAKNDYEDKENCLIPSCDVYIDLPFDRSPLGKSNIKAFKDLKKLIEEEHFDIIHCHTPMAAFLTRMAAKNERKKGTRVIYTAHGFHFFKTAPLKNWLLYYPAELMASRFTDVLITINREDYNLALKKMKAKQILYVPGVGVNTKKFFKDSSINRDEFRKKFGIEKDEKMLLSVGELIPRKNHEAVISILAKEDFKGLKWKYVICGGGILKQNLENQAKNLNIEDKVIFAGYRKDLPVIYNCADLFIFPSLQEGLPVALMEAMACGLAALASDVRGSRDLLDKEHIFSLKGDDFEKKLKKALYELPKPILLEEQYSEENIIAKMKEIYGM